MAARRSLSTQKCEADSISKSLHERIQGSTVELQRQWDLLHEGTGLPRCAKRGNSRSRLKLLASPIAYTTFLKPAASSIRRSNSSACVKTTHKEDADEGKGKDRYREVGKARLLNPLSFALGASERKSRLRVAVFNACSAEKIHPAASSCVAALLETPWFLSVAVKQLLKSVDWAGSLNTVWTAPVLVKCLGRQEILKGALTTAGREAVDVDGQPGKESEIEAGEPSFDVFLVPGGCATTDAKLLGPAGIQAVHDFVRNGGGYCGVCAGAFLALKYQEDPDVSLNLVDASAHLYDGRLRTSLSTANRLGPCLDERGRHLRQPMRNEQTLDVRFLADGRQWLWDEQREGHLEPLEDAKHTVRMRYSNGPQMVPLPQSKAVVLATSWPAESAKHSVHGSIAGAAALLMQDYHEGRAVLMSPHAESTHELAGGSRAQPGRARIRRVLQRAVLLAASGSRELRWIQNTCNLVPTLRA